MILKATRIYFTAFNINGEKNVEHELDMEQSQKLIKKEFGDSSSNSFFMNTFKAANR